MLGRAKNKGRPTERRPPLGRERTADRVHPSPPRSTQILHTSRQSSSGSCSGDGRRELRSGVGTPAWSGPREPGKGAAAKWCQLIRRTGNLLSRSETLVRARGGAAKRLPRHRQFPGAGRARTTSPTAPFRPGTGASPAGGAATDRRPRRRRYRTITYPKLTGSRVIRGPDRRHGRHKRHVRGDGTARAKRAERPRPGQSARDEKRLYRPMVACQGRACEVDSLGCHARASPGM